MKICKKLVVFLVLFVFLIPLSLLSFTSCTKSKEAEETETFIVARGDIEQTVTSTGYVDTKDEKNFSLQVSGEVFKSLKNNTSFKKGDVLIEIDNSRTKLQIKQAEKNLETAKNSLELAKIDYQQALDENHVAIQLAETNEDLSQQSAQTAYRALENANSLASKSKESAKVALENAQKILEEVKDDPMASDTQIAQYEASVDSAQGSYEQTKAQSRSSVDSAQGSYEQTSINQSTTYWQNLSSTQSTQTQIKTTAENIEQAEIQVELSETSLELAKLDTDSNIIYAPFDGIVLSSTFSQGEYASSGITAISVISSNYFIKTQINETDISKLSIGDEVKITLDAYPEEAFTGSIVEISPLSKNIDNIISFEVTIKPKEDNSSNLLYGITANLTITTSKVENVICIPIESVYEEGGKEYVDILGEDEMPQRREIVTGLYGNNYIEVISGLNEGDILIISQD